MTIPSIRELPSDPISPFTSPNILKIGELMIEGQSYTVSVESLDPLISSPHNDTLAKIKYLVDLHLTHLKTQSIDVSKILIQQIDGEGLSYVNEELESKSVRSADVTFNSLNNSSDPFSPVYSIPLFQHGTISSVSDVYRSIIESLTGRGEEAPIIKKFSNSRITFTPKFDPPKVEDHMEKEITELLSGEPKNSSEFDPPKVEDHIEKEITELLSGKPNDSSEFDPEIEDYTESEITGLLSEESRDSSEYEYKTGFIPKVSNAILDIASNVWNRIPNMRKNKSNNQPLIKPLEIITDEISGFMNNISELEKSKLDQITSIKFTENLQ